MKYSEFLSQIIESCQHTARTSESTSPAIYLCLEARYVATRDYPEYPKHLKRFLAHIKRLLNIQHKMRKAEFGNHAVYSTVLGHYFKYNHLNKINWLIELQARIQKQEMKGN